ncbi:MAG: ribose 5-phosphate isomerase A [Conexivisphaerales archaeon]
MRFDLLDLGDLRESLLTSKRIGLGSGRTVAAFLRYAASAGILNREASYIPSSSQIASVAYELGLALGSDQRVEDVQVTVDGADQVLPSNVFIKGGGGALLKEKILWSVSNLVYVMVTREKLSQKLTVPIPLEVHPMAINAVISRVSDLGGKGVLRVLERGYIYTTENGNVIVDVTIRRKNVSRLERELKTIPGVLEVGIFTDGRAKLCVVPD